MNCVTCGTISSCTDGSGQWWCKSDFPYVRKEVPKPEPELLSNSCNRHNDCAAANKRVAEAKIPDHYYGFRTTSDHCHDDYCEDCFGK